MINTNLKTNQNPLSKENRKKYLVMYNPSNSKTTAVKRHDNFGWERARGVGKRVKMNNAQATKQTEVILINKSSAKRKSVYWKMKKSNVSSSRYELCIIDPLLKDLIDSLEILKKPGEADKANIIFIKSDGDGKKDPYIFKILSKFTTLIDIRLIKCNTDKNWHKLIKVLKKNYNLRHLALHGDGLNNTHFKHILRTVHTDIKTIDLRNNKITEEIKTYIRKNVNKLPGLENETRIAIDEHLVFRASKKGLVNLKRNKN